MLQGNYGLTNSNPVKIGLTMFVLYIGKGRWSNIPRENRYCEFCQKNQIGDEYHYIFECTNLSAKRTSLLPKHLIERPNIKIFFKFKISFENSIIKCFRGIMD
jgi:hypothetical protein